MDDQTVLLLNEVVKNAEMGKNNVTQLLGITDEERLKIHLNRQLATYEDLSKRANAMLAVEGEQAEGQVVYSLVDMGENAEATKYIETVYGQMHRLSAGMKTDKPAINALLQAKLGDAERRGVRMELDVTSRYAGLPMNDWEMCRVLGNLIDNAMDAMEGMAGGRLVVELYEDIRSYGFRVVNNGPAIDPEVLPRIFNTGFTTKAAGHGLGLSIVKELVEDCGGEISVESAPGRTAFAGTLPKGEIREEESK